MYTTIDKPNVYSANPPKRFDAPEHLHEYMSAMKFRYNGENSFAGLPIEQALEKLVTGDMSAVDKVNDIISKIDISDMLTNNVVELQSSLAGFVPNIPAVISGAPETMYDLVNIEEPSINAPINVYIEALVSEALTDEQIFNRGIATLAFCMVMNMVRPIELYVIGVSDVSGKDQYTGHVTKVASKPLDIARAAYMLTDKSFARRIAFTIGYGDRGLGNTGWLRFPFNRSPATPEYKLAMREFLDMSPEDIFIQGGHLFEPAMLNDPIAWVNDMVRKHSNRHGE